MFFTLCRGHASINFGAVPSSAAPTPSPSRNPESLSRHPAPSPSESNTGGCGTSNLGYKCASKLQGGKGK